MVKLKHDIEDDDLRKIGDIVKGAAATINGMTVTLERFRQLFEDALAKKLVFSASLCGFEILKAEGGLE